MKHNLRKLLLTEHIAQSVGWLGAVGWIVGLRPGVAFA
jgi:hypothetical protein